MKRFLKADNIAFVSLIISFVILIILTVVIVKINDGEVIKEEIEETKPKSFFWGYECINNKCQKVAIDSHTKQFLTSLPACHLICLPGSTLWPIPTGNTIISKTVSEINSNNIQFNLPAYDKQIGYWTETKERFFKIVKSKIPKSYQPQNTNSVNIRVTVINEDLYLSMDTDESSELMITTDDSNNVLIAIKSATYYGAIHALESVSQLIIYDDLWDRVIIPKTAEIKDGPVYKFRGFLLDTVRHYYSVESIKRTIDAMALVKLNVFHWHITDSQSFPLELRTYPELSRAGAYSPLKTYNYHDIADVVKYARIRGIRVLPEFDAPSHVGEGWHITNLITCYNQKPWMDYCVGPPCGQLDVTKEELYEMLHRIYIDVNDMFDYPDLFHMGGDEIIPACWNVSIDIQKWMMNKGWTLQNDDFIKLWNYFQNRAQTIWTKISNAKLILWSSSLTENEHVEEYLDKDKYIIHVWTDGKDVGVKNLLEKGYDLIMSNSDRFYFDCGFGSWVDDGNNWCSPYKGWHRVYDNNLQALSQGYENQILGGEACLWSSINDEQALDSRLWPRLSAVGERLWAEPNTTYREAEARMLLHREFLIQYGIHAEPVQPEWCLQNLGECIPYYFWGYECINNKCQKVKIDTHTKQFLTSLPACHLLCLPGSTLWPIPTGNTNISKTAQEININNFRISITSFDKQIDYWTETKERFFKIINSKIPKNYKLTTNYVNIKITVTNEDLYLSMNTDESSELRISNDESNNVLIEINSATYYGARHALESVSQLIIYDDLWERIVIPKTAEITDGPVYKFRGVLLDTARHYCSVESIKRTIDAMALVKLNVFHWHITDSQSFPLHLRTYPEMSHAGAYSPEKIYNYHDIADVVKYARIRGIRVLPEFDTPSHVGEGWQFTDFVTCFNQQPWTAYCAGPPCGQLDVTKEELYEMLHRIYIDVNDMFDYPDLFHMGGDEIDPACWNVSIDIQKWMMNKGWTLQHDGFMKLWEYFQKRAETIWTKISNAKLILWASSLTEKDVEEYLDKDKYIIHIWRNGKDAVVKDLLEKGYDLIMSNADRFYLDCGFGSWVDDGDTWCSPYNGWHRAYDNNLRALSQGYENQILGGEACLWSSNNDDQTLDSRLWPRTSAVAERLWAEPNTTYREAEARMLFHREFLTQYGIQAESIQPEWCLQNPGECIR